MFLLLGDANSRDPVVPRASAVPAFSWEGSRLPFVFLPSRFIILADPAGLLLFEALRAVVFVMTCWSHHLRLTTGRQSLESSTDRIRIQSR